MKQNHILYAAALSVLLLNGCGRNQSQIEYIGAEQAKQLAVNAAGMTTTETESLTADLSSRNGTDYYRIDFLAGGEKYSYDIDALTGIIIESRTPESNLDTEAESAPMDSGSGLADASPVSDNSGEVQTDSGPVSDNSGSVQTDSGSALSDPGTAQSDPADHSSPEKISIEQAKAAALAHAGLSADQVTFVKSQTDWENGHEVYEVEFYAANHTEYDYDIDAYTGEVLKYDYDAEDYSAPTPSEDSNRISEAQAKELALAQVPGASAEHIREFETDYDDGRAEYEGKIIYNGMEYEFEIDAYSGAFRSWEAEPVD